MLATNKINIISKSLKKVPLDIFNLKYQITQRSRDMKLNFILLSFN